jgi:DUF2924 family protein
VPGFSRGRNRFAAAPLCLSDGCKEALSRLPTLDLDELREEVAGSLPKPCFSPLSRELLVRAVAYRMQEVALGGLRPEPQRQLRQIAEKRGKAPQGVAIAAAAAPVTRCCG